MLKGGANNGRGCVIMHELKVSALSAICVFVPDCHYCLPAYARQTVL